MVSERQARNNKMRSREHQRLNTCTNDTRNNAKSKGLKPKRRNAFHFSWIRSSNMYVCIERGIWWVGVCGRSVMNKFYQIIFVTVLHRYNVHFHLNGRFASVSFDSSGFGGFWFQWQWYVWWIWMFDFGMCLCDYVLWYMFGMYPPMALPIVCLSSPNQMQMAKLAGPFECTVYTLCA